MAVPAAPLPLRSQVLNTGAIVVTVPLAALDRNFDTNAAGPFNPGTLTATYTFGAQTFAQQELCDLLDRMYREGSATVA